MPLKGWSGQGKIRFLSAGRLLYWKGFHLGLRGFAAANIANAEYVIFGDGPDRVRLEALARELNISDRVTFHGAAPRNEFLCALSSADVLVHPSLHDSGGGVCLEAMAAVKPVICLHLGGPATIVNDATGFRVGAMSPEQAIRDLGRAMQLLSNDAPLRSRLGTAGRARCREVYDWDRRAQHMANLYADVCANRLRATAKVDRTAKPQVREHAAPAESIAVNLELRNANS